MNVTDHARRPLPAQDREIQKEEALRRYPVGTKVAREVRRGGSIDYVMGAVRAFIRPYWRVRYEDDEWEDMTSSQLNVGILLADRVEGQLRALGQQQPEPDSEGLREEPQGLRLVVMPRMPADFGPAYIGHTLRYKFPTGWSRGTLGRCHASRRDRGEFTFAASFPNVTGKRPVEKTLKLRVGYYSTDPTAEFSSWYLLSATTLRDVQGEEDAQVAYMAGDKRSRR